MFSFAQCLEKCRWAYLAAREETQCDLPFMPLAEWAECATKETMQVLMDLYLMWQDPTEEAVCQERCPQPCQSNIYTAIIQRKRNITDKSQNQIHIFYPSGVYEVKS